MQKIRYQKERETKRAFWEPHISSWQASMLSAKRYCRENNLKESSFTYWRHIIVGKMKNKALPIPMPHLFLEVKSLDVPSPTSEPTSIRIETPRGVKIFLESQNLEKDLNLIFRLSE